MEDAKQKELAKAKKKAILLRAVVCATLIGTAIMRREDFRRVTETDVTKKEVFT